MSRLRDLHNFGQSPWYDNIERSLLLTGKLKKMIDDDGISGVTSNPSIFEKAINGSDAYNADIEAMAKQGKSTQDIYDALTIADISTATDILESVYAASNKVDGFVSIEVSPHLAHDAEKTVQDAKRLLKRIAKENLMIKVPATVEGVDAIRRLTADGVNVNATLIFSQEHYLAVARAYILGLEERAAKGLPVDGINSVASFFVSRIDSAIDKMLDSKRGAGDEGRLEDLKGKAAVAQSKVIYALYRGLFISEEFARLKESGANVQRLLFGSTSTKNPAYSDVKYVEEIIGEGTVNTLPHATVDAFRNHGKAKASACEGLESAKQILSNLQELGISVEAVCQKLQDDGVQAFINSFDNLISSLESKRTRLVLAL